MLFISALQLLPGPLWSRVEIPVRVPSMGQIELFDHLTVRKQMTDVKLLVLHNNTWNHLSMCKRISSFEQNYLS